MATYQELTDQGFDLSQGDSVYGTIGGGDGFDIFTASLEAGRSYDFTLLFDDAAGSIELTATLGSEVFSRTETATGGWHTMHLSITPTVTGSFDIGVATGFAQSVDYEIHFGNVVPAVGTEGHDDLRGTSLDDTVDLGGGDDFIDSGGGDDVIYGGWGRDRVHAGSGNDWIDAGNHNDYVIGGAGDDTIYGGAGSDVIEGGDGDDHLVGGAGNNVMDGGSNNDMIIGGRDNDRMTGGGGNDTMYGGNGNDRLLGQGGDDLINAGDGSDLIHGGAGNDKIIPGGGDDHIIGGAGNDIFVFASGMDTDTIRDFTDGEDILDFSNFGFTSMNDLTIRQAGADAIVAVDSNWYVILRNFDSALLDDADFGWA